MVSNSSNKVTTSASTSRKRDSVLTTTTIREAIKEAIKVSNKLSIREDKVNISSNINSLLHTEGILRRKWVVVDRECHQIHT